MVLFMLVAAALLGLPVFGVWPSVGQGRAWNGAWRVTMPDPLVYGPRTRAVKAQEIAEWWTAWAGAVLIAAPIAWALAAWTPLGIAAPLLLPIAWHWRNTTWGRARLELIGWAAEWIEGQRSAPDHYRDFDAHVAAMAGGYQIFAGADPAALTRAMRARIPMARMVLTLLDGWLVRQRSARP